MTSQDEVLGAGLVGLIISTFVLGITSLQVYQYFCSTKNDPLYLKIFIIILCCLDLVHECFAASMVYFYTVSNFGKLEILDTTMWSLQVIILIGSLITASVQIFYANRIYLLMEKRILLPLIVVTISLAHLAFAVAFVCSGIHIQHFVTSRSEQSLVFVALFLSLDIVCDLVITGALCIFLHVNRTDCEPTSKLINTLITYTINTGLLTALCCAASLITFLVMPANLVFVAFYLVACRLYVNALLSTLNSRDGVNERWRLSQLHLGRSLVDVDFSDNPNRPLTLTQALATLTNPTSSSRSPVMSASSSGSMKFAHSRESSDEIKSPRAAYLV